MNKIHPYRINNHCIIRPVFLSQWFLIIVVTCYEGDETKVESCCTENFPCEIDEGDCDSDSECAGNLTCGEDNCGAGFSWSSADCYEGISESLHHSGKDN